MPLYAKIDRQSLAVLEYKDFEQPVLADHPGKPKWVPVAVAPEPAYDDTNEELERGETVTLGGVTVAPDGSVDDANAAVPPPDTVPPDGVAIAWNVVAASARTDERQLTGAGRDTALVVVELIDYLAANTALRPDDFSPNVRAAHHRLKTRVDRIK